MTAWVYRLHDADGQLLYIGCTRTSVKQRSEAHRRKAWGSRIAEVSAEPYLDHAAALATERTAIASERPIYNKGPGGNASGPRGKTGSDHWRLADFLLKEQNRDLESWLIEQRENGLGRESIAKTLWVLTDRQIDVTGQTIANWLKSLKQEST